MFWLRNKKNNFLVRTDANFVLFSIPMSNIFFQTLTVLQLVLCAMKLMYSKPLPENGPARTLGVLLEIGTLVSIAWYYFRTTKEMNDAQLIHRLKYFNLGTQKNRLNIRRFLWAIKTYILVEIFFTFALSSKELFIISQIWLGPTTNVIGNRNFQDLAINNLWGN